MKTLTKTLAATLMLGTVTIGSAHAVPPNNGCPSNTTGYAPNCKCKSPFATYIPHLKKCFYAEKSNSATIKNPALKKQ